MKAAATPWIASKVLAAGAIPPRDGFKYAFQNGADFIAVGMLDLFVQEDIEAVMQVCLTPRSRTVPAPGRKPRMAGSRRPETQAEGRPCFVQHGRGFRIGGE